MEPSKYKLVNSSLDKEEAYVFKGYFLSRIGLNWGLGWDVCGSSSSQTTGNVPWFKLPLQSFNSWYTHNAAVAASDVSQNELLNLTSNWG